MLLKIFQFITSKNVPTGVLVLIWFISTTFLYFLITDRNSQPFREIEFSESFEHELDAYDIFALCGTDVGMRFTTPSPYGLITFSCMPSKMSDYIKDAVYYVILWFETVCFLIWIYASYMLIPRFQSAYIRRSRDNNILSSESQELEKVD